MRKISLRIRKIRCYTVVGSRRIMRISFYGLWGTGRSSGQPVSRRDRLSDGSRKVLNEKMKEGRWQESDHPELNGQQDLRRAGWLSFCCFCC